MPFSFLRQSGTSKFAAFPRIEMRSYACAAIERFEMNRAMRAGLRLAPAAPLHQRPNAVIRNNEPTSERHERSGFS
jgi:hypothetical protein